MLRRLLALTAAAAVALGVVVWRGDFFPAAAPSRVEPTAAAVADGIGPPLYPSVATPAAPPQHAHKNAPLVLSDCRLSVIDKQDVPSQREGVVLFIGTEVLPGETVAPEQLINVRLGGVEKHFRRLKEGDEVGAGQMLAYLDDRMIRDDLAIKQARVASARADLNASIKGCDESNNRYLTQLWLQKAGRGVAAEEDVRGAKLTLDRATFEVETRRQDVVLAERELSQCETVLQMHEIRTTSAGVIKSILKKPGEAVRAFEPVVQVQQCTRLRVEGTVDVSQLSRLRLGMPAVVEPSRPEAPQQVLVGHLQEITGIAVGCDGDKPVIVSADMGGTVRIWDRTLQHPGRDFSQDGAVLAIACTPTSAPASLCLTGAADGTARLWALDGTSRKPLRELHGHTGAVTAVAFSPDGKLCATAGEDRAICLWDVSRGTLRYRLPTGHQAAVTSIQLTPRCQLVSAGRDNTLRLWALGRDGGHLTATFAPRSGELTQLGVSPDGGHGLYEEGSTLRLLSFPDGRTDGVVESLPRATRFAAFALFAPDGRRILSAGADGRLHLWQTPTENSHAAELHQMVMPDAVAPTCAAFAPDGSFVAVGGRDRRIRVWPLTAAEAGETSLTAHVILIDRSVDASTHEARIWAELPNSEGRCLPGTSATLVIGGEE